MAPAVTMQDKNASSVIMQDKNAGSVATLRPVRPSACMCWEMVSHILSTLHVSSLGTKPSAAQACRDPSPGLAARECRDPQEGRDPSPEPAAAERTSLRGKYAMGSKLAQGAFGSVYMCTDRSTQEDFAVKLIDPEKVPLNAIHHEADMMRRLAHPCVVKFHELFHESSSVALVLDLHEGGDLIGAMVEAHQREQGELPVAAVQNIVKMVVQSLAWLHQNHVLHRDVKGDNFLLGHRALDDPSCRIYLTDFGTAAELEPEGRLHRRAGTRAFWSPEVLDRDYAFPVDMWAAGVVMYGLVAGRFPFNGKHDIRGKLVQCPATVSEDGEAFLLCLLEREEAKRLTASQALEHPFLSCVKSGVDLAEEQAPEKLVGQHCPSCAKPGSGGAEERALVAEHAAKEVPAGKTQQDLSFLCSRCLASTTAGATSTEADSDLRSDGEAD